MNTMHHSMTGAHARWAVLWIKKNGKWKCVDFENDFAGANELYFKVKVGGRKGATLLCRNVGFPPATKYAPKMGAYNQRGYLWCPYCREMRRFKKASGFMVDDVYVHEPNRQCPVCGITTENHHVRKYNPSLNPMKEVISNGKQPRRSSGQGNRGASKLTEEQRAAKRERARRRRERRGT
jgi:hypothetical protein